MDNKARKTFRLILFIVGAAMIALGVGLTLRLMIADSERQDLKNKYIETEAFVDSVDSKINMYSEGPDKIVMAHYTVDGKLYDNVQIFDYPATISVRWFRLDYSGQIVSCRLQNHYSSELTTNITVTCLYVG